MDATNSDISCGVGQLYEMGEVTLNGCVKSILEDESYNDERRGFYIWSNVTKSRHGEERNNTGGHRLATFITEAKLGEITVSESTVNPNTKNEICIWIWKVNRDALIAYADKHEI